jgi:cytochrome c nitrite reductase small subunit
LQGKSGAGGTGSPGAGGSPSLRVRLSRSGGSALPWVLAIACGVAAGIGMYTFVYAKGFSYLKTDPVACTSCHIMQPEYAGWQKSSHHTSAVCVDCHLPEAFIPKYLAKLENGYRHGKLFTTQEFEEPITVKAKGLEILQANCERCHGGLVHELALNEPLQCIHCHWTVGHGERAGIGGPLRASELEAQVDELGTLTISN